MDRGPETGELVMALARRVRRATLDALAEWGVTPSQSRALRVVGAAGEGVRMSVLADALHIAPRSATEVADALEDKGWVRRSADPGDRRATLLALTDAGRTLLAEVDVARRRASEDALAVLSPAQRRTLHDILTVVVGEDQ